MRCPRTIEPIFHAAVLSLLISAPTLPAASCQPVVLSDTPARSAREQPARRGPVQVVGHALVDDGGPFLGLGVSYFTALWRFRNDPRRLESDLSFLSRQGFNYYRMLSMVGWNAAWDGLEIAPVSFTSRAGKRVEAWPDYWRDLGGLIDLAYDRYGLRTQITIFADAQLMPDRAARIAHMDRLLRDIVPGREHKIILLEVANEAWQNGFPGESGVKDLRKFAAYLAHRTRVPVAITLNHEGSFESLYKDSAADLATWHFSRDRRADSGWGPVIDCWRLGDLPGLPPVVSNEPIGPGASVASENDPARLVMAAVCAYISKLPAYVFHSGAGVMGKTRFEDMPGIRALQHVVRLLPADLANWRRNDGLESSAVFTAYAGGAPNRTVSDAAAGGDGCVRNLGSRKGDRFVCAPVGIRPGGLRLDPREAVSYTVIDPASGQVVEKGVKQKGETLMLPGRFRALLILGRVLRHAEEQADYPSPRLSPS